MNQSSSRNPKDKRLTPQFALTQPTLDLPAEELALLKFWKEHKVFERSVEARASAKPFVFFEGPPTANAKPGIHHVEARAFKDAIPRFQTMRGRRVERKAGWDTHGLPVELQVEKQLGISGKPQIENLVPGDIRASIAKFNALCRESVWQYKGDWEQLTERMGFWIDLTHPYITYENEYIESVWWVLKQLWDKQLLYEDFKVVPYCPRCGTALSSHEVAQGYEETTDRSVYIKFTVRELENTYLLAWTTTPWTLPGNLALAIGKNISYSVYEDQERNERYILADDRVNEVFGADHGLAGKPISTEELLQLSYEPLFDIPSLQSDKSYRVYPADFVTTADGTGIVHTAVMYGEDDFVLGNSIGLPKHHTVDLEGNFTADVADFAGAFVKDEATNQAIIDFLHDSGVLLKEVPYTHTYPFCWRCKTPLLYYAKRSWFIRMSSLRQALLDRNQTIRWVPDHLQDGRFGEWLREVKDWALSRDRYWGTPLPIWHCSDCEHQEFVGSAIELAEKYGQPLADLHKPYIDDVEFPCTACNGVMKRYPEVIDVWFDSGAMPYAQWHYPYDQDSARRVDDGENYPADYITEAVDQTRGWFYTLLAIATALDKPAPYKSVVSLGHVLDKTGKKMSKSKGNTIDPTEVFSTSGADALRFYFYSVNQPGDSKKIDLNDVAQVVRKTFLILWNTYSFLAQKVQSSELTTVSDTAPKSDQMLDQWLVARTVTLTKTVTNSLELLDFFTASRAIADLITELSTWYLKLSRKRTDESFLPTFSWSMKRLVLLMAPLTPFLSELLWQRLRSDDDADSVHLANWPTDDQSVDPAIIPMMEAVRQVVELGRAARAKAGVKVRQPLATAFVHGVTLSQSAIKLIQDELNVHAIVQTEAPEISVEFDLAITDELKAEGLSREIARAIQDLRKEAALLPGQNAVVSISGDKQLFDNLEPFIPAIAERTATTIQFGETNSDISRVVESLTISLVLP